MSSDPFAGTEPPGGVDYGTFGFRAKRWVLLSLAEAAVAAVPASAAIPVLGCFRVQAGEGFLEFAGTDMDRTVLAGTQAVDAKDTPEGTAYEAFIPARRLLAILKEAQDDDCTVAVKKNQAKVTVGGVTWELRLPDGSSYPELVNPGQLAFQSYSREKLLAGLRAVRHVVCKDAGQPALTQVAISETGDEQVITASDGVRLARAGLAGFPAAMRIPSSALDDLVKLLNTAQDDSVGIAATDDVLVFQAGSVCLAVATRSNAFPDVDKQMLKPAREHNQDLLTVVRDELLAAVRRVRINADRDTSAIVLEAADGKVMVVSRDKLGNSAAEAIPAKWQNGTRVLCVNHASLTEMLTAHPSASCEFRLGKDIGKRRSMILLEDGSVVQIIAQMPPALVGY